MLLYIADFNGVVLVQNYLERAGREEWAKQVISSACNFLILPPHHLSLG